jgi:hypothetical protein
VVSGFSYYPSIYNTKNKADFAIIFTKKGFAAKVLRVPFSNRLLKRFPFLPWKIIFMLN